MAVIAPYGTSFGSVAAKPAATPLVVPASPPKIMAAFGLSKPIILAITGVPIVTSIDFATPAAMLMAIRI